MNIRDINVKQVREVLEGKRTGRRAGHTITKMIMMIAHAFNANADSDFLFVGQNGQSLRDIQITFFSWLDDVGFDVSFGEGETKEHPRRFGMFNNHIKSFRRGHYINFTFLAADEKLPCMIRGTRYDRAFVDVSWELAVKYVRELDEIKYHLY